MSQRRPPDRLIITIPPAILDHLRRRGGRSDRTHGPLNYTRLLTRHLELYLCLLRRSDPRLTRALPADQYELILELLAEPLELEPFHIHRLGDYLADRPDFLTRTREAGIDAAELAAAVAACSFAEKLHLADAAQIRHAPRPPHPPPPAS